MRKHNEGYALALVLVVLVVVCLVAVSILTISVNNLNAQRVAITQMQEKYKVQGIIEEAMAVLEKQLAAQPKGFGKEYLDDVFTATEVNCTEPVVDTVLGIATFQLSAEDGMYKITCDIAIEASFEPASMGDLYNFSELRGVKYTSYKIELIEGTGGDSL